MYNSVLREKLIHVCERNVDGNFVLIATNAINVLSNIVICIINNISIAHCNSLTQPKIK